MLKKDLTKIYDCHTHFDDVEEYEPAGYTPEKIIKEAEQVGVGYFNNVAYDMESCHTAIKQVEPFENAFAIIGIHPNNVNDYDLDETLKEFESMIKNKKVVGIGEVGLDYFIHKNDIPKQKRWFKAQAEFAKKHNLPLMMHIRDDKDVYNSYDDVIEILKEVKPKTMIVHCFSGDAEYAKKFLSIGCYLEVGGTSTFKNAKKLQEAIKHIPLDKLLLETDAPYLTPHPHRGEMNFSKYIVLTAEKIAELKGVDKSEVIRQTTNNAFKIFIENKEE